MHFPYYLIPLSTQYLMKVSIHVSRDAALICRLNREVHNHHYESHPDVFKPYDVDTFLPWYEEMLAKDTTLALVAFYKNEPVGYALLFIKKITYSPFVKDSFSSIHIDQMGVNESFRGKGIGKKLMEEVRNIAKERGVSRIQLSVWSDNAQARRFYENLGFEPYLVYMEKKVILNSEFRKVDRVTS
jgi:ribosomal protein S18 acetylase RimI-like enzyme